MFLIVFWYQQNKTLWGVLVCGVVFKSLFGGLIGFEMFEEWFYSALMAVLKCSGPRTPS